MRNHPLGLIIRADASPYIGTGHIMRCLALAQWAQAEDIKATLISRVSVAWVIEKIHQAGIDFRIIAGEPPSEEDPLELLEQIGIEKSGGWVILDGYHFGPDCQKKVRATGHRLLVIDDYMHQPEYSCDILLNQNIGADDFAYTGDIGQKLLGPRYTLLRPEFAIARERARHRVLSEKVCNVLLTLGGGDFSDHLGKVADCFAIPELASCILRVIAGAMPHDRIRDLLRSCPAKIEILSRVDDMPALLLDTDLCVTAGGSTCWELCCLGVPFLTLEVAENQSVVIKEMMNRNIALPLSVNNFKTFLFNFNLRHENAMCNMSIVDGEGPKLVLNAASTI